MVLDVGGAVFGEHTRRVVVEVRQSSLNSNYMSHVCGKVIMEGKPTFEMVTFH